MGLTFGTGEQCGDHIGLVVFDLFDHLVIVSTALDVKAQAGAQPDQLKQIRADPAKVVIAIEKRQWRIGFVDDDAHCRVMCQPAFFPVSELQLLIGQQNVAAGAPAFGDVFSLTGGNGPDHRVDDAEQFGVVPVDGKAEAMGFMFAEVGHPDVVQVPLVDHVVS
ncbi:hypothetical protein D3C81_1165780 [compost metagenome]